MDKRIIFQCGSCGMLEPVSLDGGQQDIEEALDEFIDAKGWRFTRRWHGWICKDCIHGKGDPLYDKYFGKPTPCTEQESWEQAKQDAKRQLDAYRKLEEVDYGGIHYPG